MDQPIKIRKEPLLWILLMIILVLSLVVIIQFVIPSKAQNEVFDSARAYEDVVAQTSLGPRTPGSTAHGEVVSYIQNELRQAGWEVEIQNAEALGHPLQNIIATQGNGTKSVVIGAHYDSRLVANRDPNEALRSQPVPGANDGASGVAVLLELARTLPKNMEKKVTLVFFDLEDQGNLAGWDWCLGSQTYVDSLKSTPDAVIVIDMIGDKDLNIYREKTSTQSLVDEIWSQAAQLGYENIFINQEKYAIQDDHTAFLEAGIKAIDIIDFDYAYWHTTSDTADKVSPQSLETIGKVLTTWLLK